MNASPRTSRLFADRASAAASVSGRNSLGCVAPGSAGRVGFVASDGAHGDLAAPRPAQLPDLPNWSWHEYGMRVGFWRLKKMLERLGISPTVTLNAKVCETYPQVIEACIDNGWELNAQRPGADAQAR